MPANAGAVHQSPHRPTVPPCRTQQQYGDESAAPPTAAYSLHATTTGGKDEGEAGPPPSRAPTRQARAWLVVVVACVAWLSCSTSIIVVNRTIMITLNFQYPLALSAWVGAWGVGAGGWCLFPLGSGLLHS